MARKNPNSGGLRVLHVTHNMAVGGAEVVVTQLIKSMADGRYRSQIVCLDGVVGELGQSLIDSGTRVHCLTRKPGFDLSLVFQLRKLVQNEQIDILHCHQYTPFSYGVLSAAFTGINVVFTEHGRLYPDTWSWKRRIVNQILQIRANTIVAISEATRDALVKYEWFQRSRIKLVYNGISSLSESPVNSSIGDDLGITSADLVIGTVSRLDSIKNQSLMIAAYARLQPEYPHVKLLLVGDGPERAKLEQQIDALGIKDHVIISGFVRDVVSYLSLIDIFLLTSFSEGTSMALLEAMSLAKPIIATEVGGNVELLNHNETALLVESDDEEGLVMGLRSMLEDSQLRTRLGLGAKAEFIEKFNVSQMTRRYEKLYEGTPVR